MRGHVDHRAAPKLFVEPDGTLVLASATRSEMVSNRTHCKRRTGKTVTLSRAPQTANTLLRCQKGLSGCEAQDQDER